jgi:hypothetical protein
LKQDAWLCELVFRQALLYMIDSENIYQENMVRVVQDVKTTDAKIIQQLKLATEEFTVTMNGELASLQSGLAMTGKTFFFDRQKLRHLKPSLKLHSLPNSASSIL